jgi:hypothetical protein
MADYRAAARRAAVRNGLDPNIFVRQIQQESGFNPNARSPAGATGIAQIMPATARGWGVDPTDPIASLNAAAKNMASYVKKYGSYENALRAYNAGPGAIERSKGFAETNNYVKTILGGKDPKRLSSPRASASAATQTTTTTPAQTSTSSVTTGGDVTRPTLPERVRPTITGPALPAYVKSLPPTVAFPDRSAPQASIRDAIAALGKVPQTTTEATTTTPAQTTTTSSPAPRTKSSGKGGSKVLELIFNNGGKGYGIKDGQVVDAPSVFSGVWGGHANHVHAAAGPKTIVALGKYAQKLGLRVSENPAFDQVDPVHTEGSYHYQDKAIDVSGSKPLMEKFAKYVVNYNRTKRLPA